MAFPILFIGGTLDGRVLSIMPGEYLLLDNGEGYTERRYRISSENTYRIVYALEAMSDTVVFEQLVRGYKSATDNGAKA